MHLQVLHQLPHFTADLHSFLLNFHHLAPPAELENFEISAYPYIKVKTMSTR